MLCGLVTSCSSLASREYTLPAFHVPSHLRFCSIFNALFLLYAIIQITEIKAVTLEPSGGISRIPINTLAIIIPIVISVAEIAYIALGWRIYTEFGWKVYKFLGADRRIKTMFAYHQIFLCLVKFDLFFWVGFSVQFIWLVLNKSNAEYYLTCAALPLSLVVLVEGHLAARHESKWMMLSFMTGCAGAMVYFVYKVGGQKFKSFYELLNSWIARESAPIPQHGHLQASLADAYHVLYVTSNWTCYRLLNVFDSCHRYHSPRHHVRLRHLGDEQLRAWSQGAEYVLAFTFNPFHTDLARHQSRRTRTSRA